MSFKLLLTRLHFIFLFCLFFSCFGIVVRKPQNPLEHECLVFAEIDPMQPVTAVIDFVQRAMKNGKK